MTESTALEQQEYRYKMKKLRLTMKVMMMTQLRSPHFHSLPLKVQLKHKHTPQVNNVCERQSFSLCVSSLVVRTRTPDWYHWFST